MCVTWFKSRISHALFSSLLILELYLQRFINVFILWPARLLVLRCYGLWVERIAAGRGVLVVSVVLCGL